MNFVLLSWREKEIGLPMTLVECNVELSTLSELIIAQSNIMFCEQPRQLVGTPCSVFSSDRKGVFA